MRKLIFATVLAIAAAAPFAASAQDEIVVRRHHAYENVQGDWRHRDRDSDSRWGRHHRWDHRRHCETRWVTHWRHHHRVVEKITVCR